ncbi:MAG: translation initiation factor [Chthoniobacterales bacterium]
MARNKDEKIDLNPTQSGLNSAFSSLLSNITPSSAGSEQIFTQKPSQPAPKKRGRVVLRRETAHRGGKCVVVVYDFPTSLPMREIENIAKQLRKTCGSGGTVKGREIEIQGEHAPKIRAFLEKEGFQVAGV